MSVGRAALAVTGVVAALATVPAAGAHVQVTPTRVAPSDPVLFTVLVPNERNVPTGRVELDIPRSIIPFGFEAAPGWRRRIERNSDQSVRSVVWTGSLPEAGFAQFRLLATTPPDPATIAWRARQFYDDGRIVRWEGEAGSESPAAVVTVDRGAPRQNAGGEGTDGASGGGTGGGGSPGGEPAPRSAPEPATTRRDDALEIAGVALGGGALAVAVIALVLAGRGAVDRAGRRGGS